MTLALYVRRLNQIPRVESVAREAHARGHRVFLLLDQRGGREGPKGEEWPDERLVPERWRKWATVVPCADAHNGRPEWPRAIYGAVVVPAPLGVDPNTLPRARAHVALQTNVTDVTKLTEWRWDAIYTWSAAWEQFWYANLPADGTEFHRVFHPVGHPLADLLPTIDHDEVRRTFGIPAVDRIVLYFPFPFAAHEQSWRLRYLYRWAPWGDAGTVRAIRSFCDRQNAALVVKSRAKTPVPGYLRRAADVVVDRDEPGEPTSLRLLSVASLFVHHMSSGVAEAYAAGVPALNIRPEGWTAYDDHTKTVGEEFYGGPLWTTTPGAVRESIASIRLNGSPPANRKDYVAKYLGPEPFMAGRRIVEDLERRVG